MSKTRTSMRLVPPDAFDRLQRRLDNAADSIMRKRLEELAKTSETLLRGAIPVGPSGANRRMVKAKISGSGTKLKMETRSRARSFFPADQGRKPGKMAPPALIAKLYKLPAQEAFLVARAIGRRGTRGHGAAKRVQPAFRREVRQTGKAIVKDLAKVARDT